MKNKYHARKFMSAGHTFDSRAEGHRYMQLRIQQDVGLISGLTLQPRFELQPEFRKNGKLFRKIEYVADFMYQMDGRTIVEDVKGMETEAFRIKRKMFEYRYPELELEIVKER